MGKILFIDARKGGDFTLDALWAGLVEYHGWENVVDWPPSEKHRRGIPQQTGNVDADYGAERMSLCYTPHHDKFKTYALSEINDMILKGQIERIFIDEREESFKLYLQTHARFMNIPVVVVAGHDRFWNSGIDALRRYYDKNLSAVFVDNWRDGYRAYKDVFPMSYATNFDHLWDMSSRHELLSNKLYNLCFLGYNSNPERAKIVNHLIEKYGIEGNKLFVETRGNVVDAFLPKREYFRIIAQSRICINLNGAAECGKALRFYEIPYVGSYMISQYDMANQVHPFLGGMHCHYFNSIEGLDRAIEWALQNESEREIIARDGHEHALKYHTSLARVNYIYGCLNGQS